MSRSIRHAVARLCLSGYCERNKINTHTGVCCRVQFSDPVVIIIWINIGRVSCALVVDIGALIRRSVMATAARSVIVHNLSEVTTWDDVLDLVCTTLGLDDKEEAKQSVVESTYLTPYLEERCAGIDAPLNVKYARITFIKKEYADLFLEKVAKQYRTRRISDQIFSSVQACVNTFVIERLGNAGIITPVLQDIKSRSGVRITFDKNRKKLTLTGLHWQVNEAKRILQRSCESCSAEALNQALPEDDLFDHESGQTKNATAVVHIKQENNVLTSTHTDNGKPSGLPAGHEHHSGSAKPHTPKSTKHDETTHKLITENDRNTNMAKMQANRETKEKCHESENKNAETITFDEKGAANSRHLENQGARPKVFSSGKSVSKLPGTAKRMSPPSNYYTEDTPAETKLFEKEIVPDDGVDKHIKHAIVNEGNPQSELVKFDSETWAYVATFHPHMSKKIADLAKKHTICFCVDRTTGSDIFIKITGKEASNFEFSKALSTLVKGIEFRMKKYNISSKDLNESGLQQRFPEIWFRKLEPGQLRVVAQSDSIEELNSYFQKLKYGKGPKDEQCDPQERKHEGSSRNNQMDHHSSIQRYQETPKNANTKSTMHDYSPTQNSASTNLKSTQHSKHAKNIVGSSKTQADENVNGVPELPSTIEQDMDNSIAKPGVPSNKSSTDHQEHVEEQYVDVNLFEYIKMINTALFTDISEKHNVRLRTENLGSGQMILKVIGEKNDAVQALDEIIGLYQKANDTCIIEKVPIVDKMDITNIDTVTSRISDAFRVLVRISGNTVVMVGPKDVLHTAIKQLNNMLMYPEKYPEREDFKMSPKDGSKRVRQLKNTSVASGGKRNDMRNAVVDPLGFMTKRETKILIYKGDITKLSVDAIVNAANGDLIHGGGLALAISKAAGPQLNIDCRDYVKINGPLPVSRTYLSTAGNMPCRHVLHAVGPRWDDYRRKSDKDICFRRLVETFANVFSFAYAEMMKTLAVPAISSGIYGVPHHLVAQAMYDGLIKCIDVHEATGNYTKLKEIHLVDMNVPILTCIKETFQRGVSHGSVMRDMTPDNVKTLIRKYTGSTTQEQARSAASGTSVDDPRFHQLHSEPQSLPHFGMNDNTSNWRQRGTSSHNHKQTESTSNVNSMHLETGHHSPSLVGKHVQGRSYASVARNPTNKVSETRETGANVSANTSASKTETRQTDVSRILADSSTHGKATKSVPDNCTICMGLIKDEKILPKCKHAFCRQCIDDCFTKMKPVCPICGVVYGKVEGNQPDGKMDVTVNNYLHLPGYEMDGTIKITYQFSGGTQGSKHPSPGRQYHGTYRTAYLPDNTEGRKVLSLLKKAFDAKLVFTIGQSVTSGHDNQVTWNDIHHKTALTGGPQAYGYPDPSYLKRVQEELAVKGIA